MTIRISTLWVMVAVVAAATWAFYALGWFSVEAAFDRTISLIYLAAAATGWAQGNRPERSRH